MWETKRAVMVQVGDVTPAGPVEAVEMYGGLHRVELRIGGVWHGRDFDQAVDVQKVGQ